MSNLLAAMSSLRQSLAASSPFKGGGGLGAPPHPCWNFEWFDLVQVLCRQQQLLRIDVCNSHLMAKSWCFRALHPIHQRNCFYPFYQVSRALGGGKVATDGIHIWACGAISTQHPKQSWVSVLATITTEESSLTGLETSQYVQLCNYKHKYLEWSLAAWPLSRKKKFPLG